MWTLAFIAGAGVAVAAKKYMSRTTQAVAEDLASLRRHLTETAATAARTAAPAEAAPPAPAPEAPEEEMERLRRRLAELEAAAEKKETSPAS